VAPGRESRTRRSALASIGKDSTSVTQDPWQHGGPIQSPTFGAILRDARLSQGRSLQDAERQTRILARHLAALENGEFQLLPPGIYARGFVYNYANWLQLNPQEMVRLFNEARGEPEAPYRPQPVARPVNTGGQFSPNFVVITFATIILAVAAAWGYSLLVHSPPKRGAIDATTLPATPTVVPGTVPAGASTVLSPTTAGTIQIATKSAGSSVSGTASGTATGTNPGASASAGTVAPTATVTPVSSLKVTLRATGKSWVEVYVDGDPNAKFIGAMNPGDTHDFEAKQNIRFKIGAPDYVSYTVNGQDKGPFPKDSLTALGYTITANSQSGG
jgi:cytoskeleton protein RodZ